MPSYLSSPQPTQLLALYPGNTVALVNDATIDIGVTTTVQVAIGPDSTGNSKLTILNTTNQIATMETAQQDIAADYAPYSVDGTAVTVATDTSIQIPTNARWIRFTFQSAPTSGSLFLTR